MNLRRMLVGLLFGLTGCNATSFSSNDATLASKSVFGGDLGRQGDGAGNGIKNNGDATGELYQTGGSGRDPIGNLHQGANGGDAAGNIHQPDGTDSEIDLLMMCSDRRSGDAANFKHAVANNLEIDLVIDTSLCSNDSAAIQALVQKKKIVLGDIMSLCPTLVPDLGDWSNVTIVVDGTPYPSKRGTITLLYALNQETDPANEAADALCDKRSSPLVVQLSQGVDVPEPIALSSPQDGVYFDLLGARNGHVPVLISWFTNHSYAMLALPDKNGKVKSIDQLFGDNTVGPDGLFADNGYAALAKYDGTTSDGVFRVAKADGRIDRNDAIYSRLRLWVDKNLDGIAQPRELVSLKQARVAYVDLGFSTAYAETDQYGNQTLMKSVVGYLDGSFDLIFDLWFAYR